MPATKFPNGLEGNAAAASVSVSAYTAANVSASYVEAEVQAIADALEALRDEVALMATELNKLTNK